MEKSFLPRRLQSHLIEARHHRDRLPAARTASTSSADAKSKDQALTSMHSRVMTHLDLQISRQLRDLGRRRILELGKLVLVKLYLIAFCT